MSANKITNQYLSLYQKKDFSSALIYLESFTFPTFENLLHYSFNNFKFTNYRQEFIKYFFEEYLPISKYFIELCSSAKRSELFPRIFEFEGLQCQSLYKRMAKEVPDVFIEIVKRNRVPFKHKKHFSEQIIPQTSTALQLEFFQKCLTVSAYEMLYYHSAVNELKKLKGKSLEEIFSLVGLWLYYYVWENTVKKDSPDFHRALETDAIDAMNNMLTLILSKKTNSIPTDFNPINFQREVINSPSEKPPLFEVFYAWKKWNMFVSAVVDELCFEDSTKVEITKDLEISVSVDPIVKEKFYYQNRKYISYLQIEDSDHEILTEGLELSENQHYFLKELGPVFFRDIRNIFDSFISEINSKDFGIESYKVMAFVHKQWLFNKIHFNSISKVGLKNKQDWKAILKEIDVTDKQFLRNQFPLAKPMYNLLEGNNDQKIKDAANIKPGDYEKCLELTTLDLNKINFSNYNRFKPQINLFHSVWYKIREHYYCFPQIISSMQVHSFISNLALVVHKHNNDEKHKASTNFMEKFISELGQEAGLIAESNFKYGYSEDKKSLEYFSGEIDAVFYDGESILGIEFKRSALRGSLEEINYECEVIINGAITQLDRFKKSVKFKSKQLNKHLKLDEAIDLSKLPIYGIIVSTNFEFDHEAINGYIKISWIEFLWLVDTLKPEENINILMERIKNNDYWELERGI